MKVTDKLLEEFRWAKPLPEEEGKKLIKNYCIYDFDSDKTVSIKHELKAIIPSSCTKEQIKKYIDMLFEISILEYGEIYVVLSMTENKPLLYKRDKKYSGWLFNPAIDTLTPITCEAIILSSKENGKEWFINSPEWDFRCLAGHAFFMDFAMGQTWFGDFPNSMRSDNFNVQETNKENEYDENMPF